MYNIPLTVEILLEQISPYCKLTKHEENYYIAGQVNLLNTLINCVNGGNLSPIEKEFRSLLMQASMRLNNKLNEK